MKTMLTTKLIVLDGLPGSGKSTTAEWLTLQLQRNGVNAVLLLESDVSHPLWWYNYWNGTEYLPPDFTTIPIETHIETSLQRWQAFVHTVIASDQLYVAESVFFQNAIAMFVIGGAEPGVLMDYANEVQMIARDLHPALIYFYHNDVALALRRICAIRGREFEDELLYHMESFPFLKQRNLQGLDGVTILWQAIRVITDALFDQYTIDKLALEHSDNNWLVYRKQIQDFLGIPMNPKDIVRTGYDTISHAYRGDTLDQHDPSLAKYSQWVAELTGMLPADGAVLDLGCGNGIPVAQLLADAGYMVTGIDISAVQIARAQVLVPNAHVVCADMTKLAFPLQTFAAIISLYAIIHVPLAEQPALFANMYRWLQPGGYLMVIVGAHTWTGTEADWLDVAGGTMYWSHADTATYQQWCEDQGFTLCWVRFIPEGNGGHTLILAQKPGSPIKI